MNSSLISVVIPVYNVENYLHECLDSVLGQTYKNLQIILVDDGSSDSSGTICDAYCKKDTRIQVVHQANQGVSSARNTALDLVTGQYIAFVDADDILPQEAISTRLQQMDSVDLISTRMQKISSQGALLSESKELAEVVLNPSDALWFQFDEEQYGYLGFITDKLFLSDIICKNGIRFHQDIKLNEDRLFITEYLLHTTQTKLVNCNTYYYRQRDESALGETKKSVTPGELTVTVSFDYMKEAVKEQYPNVYYLICRRAFECGMTLYNRVPASDKVNRQYLKKTMWKNAMLYLKSPELSIIGKIKVVLHCILVR